MRISWAARVKEQSGAELVEAALVIPLLFTLLLGIVWIGRGYNTYATITLAAREGARLAALPTCATCGSSYPTDTQVRAVVDQSLSAASLQPSQVSNFTITRNLNLTPGAVTPQNGVRVSFGYPVSMDIPFLPHTSVSISTNAQMRLEQQ